LGILSHITAYCNNYLELDINRVYLISFGLVTVLVFLYTPPILKSITLYLELYSNPPIAYLEYPIPRSYVSLIGIHNTVAILATISRYKAEYD
jgi:hypothetical protein